MSNKKSKELAPAPEAPKRIQVTPENASILTVGLLNNVVEQNRSIIMLLGSINAKLTKPATDLGGPKQ